MLQVWGSNTGVFQWNLRNFKNSYFEENLAKLLYNTVTVTFNRPEICMVIQNFSENKCIDEKEIADLLILVIYYYLDYICQQAIY